MKRRNGSGKFLPLKDGELEGPNPMDGVANLADVMLVFACGLMLALITYWNVDVGVLDESPQTTDVPNRQELAETVSDLADQTEETVDSGGLEQYGTVYRDPETGKLYLATEEHP